ncbi:SEC-C domain-containing protein [Yoonia sp. SS1-5]|uniref:SEC-C domain-containing protein n=1 Tax=Yoonia rhodophyticola TaxID=3137370 RepID=A0AAN0NJY8_9RHOB
MFEKILHGGNIAAAFTVVATTADLTLAAGTATALSAALSGTAIYKESNSETKALAKEMALLLKATLSRMHLTQGRKRIVTQLISLYQFSDSDIIESNLDAATLADTLCGRIAKTAVDPAHKTSHALEDFRSIVRAILEPILNDVEVVADLQPLIQRELLLRTQNTGAGNRLRDAGITEEAIVNLAQRFSTSTSDVGQAWLDLNEAVERAIQIQNSDHPDFDDNHSGSDELKRASKYTAEGRYGEAISEILAVLNLEEDLHNERKIQLLDRAIDLSRLDYQPKLAAKYLVTQLTIGCPEPDLFEKLHTLWRDWWLRGRDKGLNFDTRVAIHLAEESLELSLEGEQRASALRDLGNALYVVGDRKKNVGQIEKAIDSYRASLNQLSKHDAGLQYALTRVDLGAALQSLGALKFLDGIPYLEDSILETEGALSELALRTVPLEWAGAQNNLGNARMSVGQITSDINQLNSAIAAFNAALTEWVRKETPRRWALAQANIGSAWGYIGFLESGCSSLRKSVDAFELALKELCRQDQPVLWARTKQSLGQVRLTFGRRECDSEHILLALKAFGEAAEEIVLETAPLDWASIQAGKGDCYLLLFRQDSKAEWLKKAISCFEYALGGFSLEEIPLQHAVLLGKLGQAKQYYSRKSLEMRYLDEAIEHAQAARHIFQKYNDTQNFRLAEEQISGLKKQRALTASYHPLSSPRTTSPGRQSVEAMEFGVVPVARNSECPCGSEKRFKHCCGAQ